MHVNQHRGWKVWLAPGLVGLALVPATSRGDDGGFFGRLFRGGSNPPPKAARDAAAQAERPAPAEPHPGSYESAFGDIGSGGRSNRVPNPTPTGPITTEGPSTPEPAGNDLQPRLSPRARVAPAATQADPLLTRTAIGKSNDGSQFGMFLQVFADGTVIDSEGVHHLAPSDIRPIAEAIQGGELTRVRGHCGTPSNDFVEYVHIVAFERRMGRLQAHSFSYANNPQGCDPGIRRIHGILENLQMKLSRSQAPTTAHAGEATAAPVSNSAAPAQAAPPVPASVIPLTPVGSR